MKRLLFVLVPLTVFAQFEVDTIIRFPVGLREGAYLQDLNKLYLSSMGHDQYLVLDCSTYQVKAEIPVEGAAFYHYSYNWRRQKLYVAFNEGPESTLVIDAVGDSVLRWLTAFREWESDAYLSDLDVRFKPAVDSLYEYECDADTIIRRWPIQSTCASWDSVDRKLYIGQGLLKKLYVYDYLADSCVKVIDVSATHASVPDGCVFSHTYPRAYVSHAGYTMASGHVGVVDTQRDTLLRVIPAEIGERLFQQVAIDDRDGKAYITGYPDTMWVVDCATDSVLKKFACGNGGDAEVCMRWVPWSNRIYLIYYLWGDRKLAIIDCNTDSVIMSGVSLGHCYDIQLDPVRQRIFVVGADSYNIWVLRDTGYEGVAEAKPAGPRLASGLQVQPASGGFDLSYSITSPCRVDLSVYDLTGREVRRLVAEGQSAGEHRVFWNCGDSVGNPVPPGVYLIHLDTPGFRSVKKAVVVR
jgi:hypothetical protein